MKGFWKKIEIVAPAPVVLWVGEWLGVFSDTPLALSKWEDAATRTALSVGTFTAMFIGLYFHKSPKFTLRLGTLGLFVLTMLLIGTCMYIPYHLGHKFQTDVILQWQSAWRLIYTVAMIAMIATVSLGALSIKEENSESILKPIIIGVLISLALIAAFLLGRHTN